MNNINVSMQAELASLDFIQPDFRLVSITGGAVNNSYRLETSDKNYFVKTFESANVVLLDRKRLFDFQLKLVDKGLAVNPIYLSKSRDFQIDEWLDTPTLDKADVSELVTINRLAASLSLIHNTEISAQELDLPAQWQHYISLIDSPISTSDQQTIDNYTTIWQNACSTKAVFCHNDLSSSHITNAQPSKVLDWEYCALSCPYFDLASCVAVNDFGIADEASLYAFYAQYSGQRLSDVIAKSTRMKPLVELTNRLWFQAANRSNTIATDLAT
ncbi:phosphotransferase [uncultured Paraglaciecola sp.]|uniref:phosphotransferase n=1 Tax=uncultured Paraglaciecola sp. TaxID=1765024 RepID=UPI0025E0D74B|nr:phosphotransferase [uncultured Paraglaciecola sp.]